MSEQFKMIESQIREIYGGVIYTHKTHAKSADLLKRKSDYIKILEIILSAVTTTSILAISFGNGYIFQFIGAFCATATLGLALYSKDFNLLGIAESHKHTALSLLEARNNLFSLLVDIKIGNVAIEDVQHRRDELNSELVKIYKSAPKTTNKAYQIASKALKDKEEFTFTDEEIDKFLPENLKRIVKNTNS